MPPVLEGSFRPFQEFQFLRIYGVEHPAADIQADVTLFFPNEGYIRLFAHGKVPFLHVLVIINKGVSIVIPVLGYIYQSVPDLGVGFRTCPLDEFYITVGHIHVFLCQPMFMVV